MKCLEAGSLLASREVRDKGLLLRRIQWRDTSFVLHFLTAEHGRLALVAKGARRPKSPFRAHIAPLHDLNLRWQQGRSGMGILLEVRRNEPLASEPLAYEGLSLLSVATDLFPEGGEHGYQEVKQALQLLNSVPEASASCAAIWQLLRGEGWLGSLAHCWHCSMDFVDHEYAYWQQGHLHCSSCQQGSAMRISAGLRKSIRGTLDGKIIHISNADIQTWRKMIQEVLQLHGLKPMAVI
ncbi:MAG: DNA repair protein RecO [Mariprofundaceae bacterium]